MSRFMHELLGDQTGAEPVSTGVCWNKTGAGDTKSVSGARGYLEVQTEWRNGGLGRRVWECFGVCVSQDLHVDRSF